MKKFFQAHPDVVIAILAMVFLGILIAMYFWAINDIFLEIHRALGSSPSESATKFDLDGAAKLDLRGLVNATASSTPSAATTTVSTSTE